MHRLMLLPALFPGPALAHAPAELAGHWVTWALMLTLAGYLLGVLRGVPRPSFMPSSLFLCGWATLAIALVGPVEHWAGGSLAGHMTQHMTLLAVAPPLLLLARPMPQFMQALPGAARRLVGPPLGRLYRFSAAAAVSAFAIHGLAIWLLHLPMPYQLVLEQPLLHDGAHLLYFTTGLWFWWSLIAPGRLGHVGFGLASVLAVLTMLHTGMLGALMTFAPQLLYPGHPAGFVDLDQLSDQQLAGLLMWVPGGMIYATTALALAGHWLRRIDPSPHMRHSS